MVIVGKRSRFNYRHATPRQDVEHWMLKIEITQKGTNMNKTHEVKHNGATYYIRRDPYSQGYNENTVRYNLNGSPRLRCGWVFRKEGEEFENWSSSLANAKLAIQGIYTGCVFVF